MIILVYHRICPEKEINSLKNDIVIEPSHFETQISLVKNRVVSFYNAVNNPFTNNNSIVLTFDDGYLDNYTYAYPILKKYNLPATIFLSVNNIDAKQQFWWDLLSNLICDAKVDSFYYLGKRFYLTNEYVKRKSYYELSRLLGGYDFEIEYHLEKLKILLNVSEIRNLDLLLSWEHIKEMLKNNITFGSHTANHKRISMIKDLKYLNNEILESKLFLESIIDSKVDMFAYPYGRETDYDKKGIKQLRKAGYKYCFTAVTDVFSDKSNLFEIPRVGISRFDSINKFKFKINRLYPKTYHIIRKITGKTKVQSWD